MLGPLTNIYGKGKRGKATELHAKLIRSRGHCENPDCKGGWNQLHTAHIISRRHAATRTDEKNAFCLCAACHMRFTDYADEWMDFIDKTIGREEYDRLKQKAFTVTKTNDAFWQAEIDRLKGLM